MTAKSITFSNKVKVITIRAIEQFKTFNVCVTIAKHSRGQNICKETEKVKYAVLKYPTSNLL